MDTPMTKEAFEARYAHDSGITTFAMHALGWMPVRCNCDNPKCNGWEMLIKFDIGDHDAPEKTT